MLHEFLSAERAELIDRCRQKVAQRSGSVVGENDVPFGIPIFLEQLVRTLRMQSAEDRAHGDGVFGDFRRPALVPAEIGTTAGKHGRELLQQGFSVDHVVHSYGDLCQAVAELASERDAPIKATEFKTLNLCLDNAIAGAVTEYAYQHDAELADVRIQSFNERMGFLAHELRNFLANALFALSALKTGKVGLQGATGTLLENSLLGMRDLIDRSLSDVRGTAGLPARLTRMSLADFTTSIKLAMSPEAEYRDCEFVVAGVDPELAIEVDPEMLLSAVGNLLQNAFKFTRPQSQVSLRAYAVGDGIRIDVADHCGGLPPGDAEKMFLPFTQSGADRSGLGLGLSICRRNVLANHGVVSVSDVPAVGCVFTIELPRHVLPAVAASQPTRAEPAWPVRVQSMR